MAPPTAAQISAAKGLLSFVEASPEPYHVVATVSDSLRKAGFTKLSERDAWRLAPGGKYFVTRNGSSVIAFCVGGKYVPGNGLHLVGAHTDSPHLKVKPQGAVQKHGFKQVGVEPYGGGLWHTWFDRDLTLAGRVLIETDAGGFETRLVNLRKPILRIPNLAIHLTPRTERDFKCNNQNHLLPILSNVVEAELNDSADNVPAIKRAKGGSGPRVHGVLADLLTKELGVSADRIREFELSVVDTQAPSLGGAYDEFIYSPRMDNLHSSYCALRALLDSTDSLADETNVRALALFDHEEVGSRSAQGAASSMMRQTIERIITSVGEISAGDRHNLLERAISRSFLMSADMAHAIHPNYSEKHDPDHAPALGKGVVIKYHANQAYATNSVTAFLVREIGRRNNIPLQDFCSRNDSPCGSTIGAIIAANSGIRTVDLGAAQLSMHSIREQAATVDVEHTINFMRAFYEQFADLDAKLNLDD